MKRKPPKTKKKVGNVNKLEETNETPEITPPQSRLGSIRSILFKGNPTSKAKSQMQTVRWKNVSDEEKAIELLPTTEMRPKKKTTKSTSSAVGSVADLNATRIGQSEKKEEGEESE